MKYLKFYEDYITGGDEHRDDAQFDHSNNPVIREAAKKYVQEVLHSNQYKKIFDELGLEPPKEVEGQELDAMFDKIEQQAVDYFVKYPEKMTITQDDEVSKMAVTGGNVGDNLSARVPVITHT